MIRRLIEKDFLLYKKVRLLQLKTDPKSFLSSYKVEVNLPLMFFKNKILNSQKSDIFGFWGYFEKGKLIAYAQLSSSHLIKKRHIANIYELYVIPKKRKIGIARKLVNFLIDKAKTNIILEQIQLKVNSRNKSAISLYEKIGFKKIAVLSKGVKEENGTYQDEYLYSLNLKT